MGGCCLSPDKSSQNGRKRVQQQQYGSTRQPGSSNVQSCQRSAGMHAYHSTGASRPTNVSANSKPEKETNTLSPEKLKSPARKAVPSHNERKLDWRGLSEQSEPEFKAHTTKSLVNMNTANVHELCLLEGVSLELANSIVDHRCTHGHFSSMQELLYVPGMHNGILQRIQPRIVIGQHSDTRKGNNQRRAVSPVIEVVPASNQADTEQVSGIRMLRLASWNLQQFSSEKASNPSITEVVCLTILNKGLHLVAFQELGDECALKKVCDELNHPTLERVKSVSRKGEHWNCVVSAATGRMFQTVAVLFTNGNTLLENKYQRATETISRLQELTDSQGMEYGGFLWKESSNVRLIKSGLMGTARTDFVRKPFIGYFQAGAWRFAVINLHLKAVGWGGIHLEDLKAEISLLSPLIVAVSEGLGGHRDVMVVGDFNISPNSDSFNELLKNGYRHILCGDVPTNISSCNLKGSKSYDNIWISSDVQTMRYTGRSGVIREGLQYCDAAVGCSTISDHCPVWADLLL